jgi:hypothetical protein
MLQTFRAHDAKEKYPVPYCFGKHSDTLSNFQGLITSYIEFSWLAQLRESIDRRDRVLISSRPNMKNSRFAGSKGPTTIGPDIYACGNDRYVVWAEGDLIRYRSAQLTASRYDAIHLAVAVGFVYTLHERSAILPSVFQIVRDNTRWVG